MLLASHTPSCVYQKQQVSGQDGAVLPPKPGSGKRAIGREMLVKGPGEAADNPALRSPLKLRLSKRRLVV